MGSGILFALPGGLEEALASLKELATSPICSSSSSHVVVANGVVLIMTYVWALKLFRRQFLN